MPIDGIGDQGHLDTQYGFPTAADQQDLQRYADLGLKVAITEADVRTFVNNATDQVPTDEPGPVRAAVRVLQMLKACLAVPTCISFTVWGFADADSWMPGFFTGEGYATIYDVNQQPKPAYSSCSRTCGSPPSAPPAGCGAGPASPPAAARAMAREQGGRSRDRTG